MKGTGWHEGWYMAVVEDVIDKDAGRASTVYVVEPSEVYKICVTEMLEEDQCGSQMRMKWNSFTKWGQKVQLNGQEKKLGTKTGGLDGMWGKSKRLIHSMMR